MTECDRLASHPFDPLRVAPGLAFDAIKRDALTACEQAVPEHSNEARLLFHRGRAHARTAELAKPISRFAYKGYLDAAKVDYEAASEKGYPFAFNNLAYAYANAEGVDKDEDKAAELYLEASNRIIACCWAPVARHMLAVEAKHDKAKVRRVVGELTRWSAALGSDKSRALLTELTANGTIASEPPLAPATFKDLPPWLRDHQPQTAAAPK